MVKPVPPMTGTGFVINGLDDRQWRRALIEASQKVVDVASIALDFDHRARRCHSAPNRKAREPPPWCRRMAESQRPEPHRGRGPEVGAAVMANPSGRKWSSAARARAHQLEAGHRLVGPGLIGLLDDEAHVDDHPIAGPEGFLGQHADVDLAVFADDIDEGELTAVALQHSHDLSRDARNTWFSPHVPVSSNRATTSSTDRTASGMAAATGSDSPMPSSTLSTSHPTTTVYGGVAPSALRLANTATGSMAWASSPVADDSVSWSASKTCTVPGAPRLGRASTSTSARYPSSRS